MKTTVKDNAILQVTILRTESSQKAKSETAQMECKNRAILDNGVIVSFININLAMTTGGNGYKTDAYINGKEAKEVKRLKGIPAHFRGQCYQPKSKGSKQIYCI